MKTRQSGLEALRIVAMTMILVIHYFYHGHSASFDNGYFFTWGLYPFFWGGMDAFFILSGWFGIHTTRKSLVRIVVYTLFFTLVNVALLAATGEFEPWQLVDAFIAPISSSKYWFIQIYFCLMLVAPLLNGGIDAISRRRFNLLFLLLTLVGLYGSWKFTNFANLDDGMTFFQGVWMYLTGRFLKLNEDFFSRVGKYWWLAAYLVIGAVGSIISMKTRDYTIYYNQSPFIVLTAVSLFMFFSRLKFQSRAVNYVATGTLGAYLVSDGLFGFGYFYATIDARYFAFTESMTRVETICYVLADMAAMILLWWVASLLLTPVANYLAGLCDKALTGVRRSIGRRDA